MTIFPVWLGMLQKNRKIVKTVFKFEILNFLSEILKVASSFISVYKFETVVHVVNVH